MVHIMQVFQDFFDTAHWSRVFLMTIWAKNNRHISSITEKQGRHADFSEEGLATGEERHN